MLLKMSIIVPGYLYEQHSSYVLPFSFAGASYFCSAIFCLMVHCLDRKRNDTSRDLEITVTRA